MKIRQRKDSFIWWIMYFVVLWTVGLHVFFYNDGFEVILSPDAGRYARLIPFCMIGLLFISAWSVRGIISGGLYATLDSDGIKILGNITDKSFSWIEIEFVKYQLDKKENIKLFDLKLKHAKLIRTHTRHSSLSEIDFKTFLDRHSVCNHLANN